MNINANKIGTKVLLAANLLFVVVLFGYFGFLETNYCLSADDFSGIDYSSQGIPGLTYAWHFYWAWEGPFLSHVAHGLLMWMVSAGLPPFFALGLVKLAMVGSSASLFSAISARFNLNLGFSKVMFAAIVFTLVLYLISPQPTQIWHWLTGMVYLYPLIFLMFGFAAILKGRLYLAIIPLAVVMQSRATYAVLIFGFIVLLAALSYWNKAENRKQWIILSMFLLFFLVIYLIAPGNYVRMSAHGNSTEFLISQFKSGLQNLFVSYNIAKMDRVLFGLIAVLPMLCSSVSIPRPHKAWKWAVPVVLYVGFAVAHETLFVYITGYCEWTRVLSLHSFLFLATACVYGIWLFGLIDPAWRAKIWPLSIIGILGLSFHLFKGYGGEIKNGQQLKADYDNRMETILAHQENGDTLYVMPMNYAGILYFEDFSEDPDNWINKDFIKAYELDFKVALKKQDEK